MAGTAADRGLHASGDHTLMRSIRRRPLGWTVSYQSLGSHYSPEPLPAGSKMDVTFMTSLAGMLLQFHDFILTDTHSPTLGAGADFYETIDPNIIQARAEQEAEANSLLGSLAPGGTRAAELAPILESGLTRPRRVVEAATALEYNLETGAWSGATLEQGQWYGMKI